MPHDHMPSEHPPSYTPSHDPPPLDSPSMSAPEPTPMHHERTLPPLPAAAAAEPRVTPEPAAEPQFAWPSSNPLTAYYQPGPSRLSPKNQGSDSPTWIDIDTPDSRGWRANSVFIDDPDVRLAAEALGDLRAGMSPA